MREDHWLGERLGAVALTWEPGDDPTVLVAEARRRSPAFAQARVPCSDVATAGALESAGFRVLDVSITLRRPAGGEAPGGACEVADARPEQRASLLAIASGHYRVSRFHMDPLIAPAIADQIKRDWLAAHLDGERGVRLLVASVASRPVGFLGVLAPERGVHVIDLIAVHADARGAGVGEALVRTLLAAPGQRVDVGTQAANTRAIRFYERLGFQTVETRYVLHLHA